jgi:hypothetical protein
MNIQTGERTCQRKTLKKVRVSRQTPRPAAKR